jgi:hypothetical protein
MSNVRSEPIKPTAPPAAAAKPRGGLLVLAIVLFVFGAIGWIAGGKYTVEGWIIALNMFGRWIGVPVALTAPRGWALVGAIVISGVIYSRVELLGLRNTVQRMPSFWIAWLLIFLTDIGSTLIGVLNPPADAAPALITLALLPWLAVVWAIVLTLMPEYLILSAIRLFKR